jgi:tRNA (guanine37-N1)-methyltransferase
LRFDVVTIFPELISSYVSVGLLGKAVSSGVLEVVAHDLRDWAEDRHRTVDDVPYGGGAGMVMRPEPFFRAADDLVKEGSHVVLLSARGHRLDHAGVSRLAARDHLVLLCGRYEGVDERVAEGVADEELSVGDYVLGGGELPALVVVEAVARLVPGVLGNTESLRVESHAEGRLEYPQYTRPPEFRGLEVPSILLSGNHGAIERWRIFEGERVTKERRPDLP